MGIVASVKRSMRRIETAKLIQQSIKQTSAGVFSGSPSKFASHALDVTEQDWPSIFRLFRDYDVLPQPLPWATYGIAAVLNRLNRTNHNIYTRDGFTISWDCALLALNKFIEQPKIFAPNTIFNHLEKGLIEESVRIRDYTLANLDSSSQNPKRPIN